MNISIKGLDQSIASIRTLIKGTQNRAELHRQIGVTVDQWIDKNFQAEGLEKKWAPLAKSTLFGRRMAGKGAKILQNNTLLLASHTYQATADKVVVGFPPGSVAEYHHFGTSPYVIRPKKSGGFLVFVLPPGGGGTTLVRRRAGAPQVGLVSGKEAKRQGLKIPSGKGQMQSVVFTREVHHPGLKARPLLPSVSLAETLATAVIRQYLVSIGR